MPDLLRETKAALKSLDIFPRKSMGQNFMVNGHTLSFIADSLSLNEGQTVLEIGSGLGFLTRELLARGARVIAVEKDGRLAARLQSDFRGRDLTVLQKDVLKMDPTKDLFLTKAVPVAGNIPYHITSPILEWLVIGRRFVSEAVLTLQWEVAQRLAAAPGTKAWGALSIFVQVYARVSILRKIAASSFYPTPKVDSAVVRLVFSKAPLFAIKDEERFFRLMRRSFQKRRKTLLNSLVDEGRRAFGKETLADVLAAAAIDPSRRPETLSIPEWATLADLTGEG